MKFNLNLAISTGPRERYGVLWAAPTSVAALVVMLGLVYFSALAARQYYQSKRSLAMLQTEESRIKKTEAELKNRVNQPQARAVWREAVYVNELIARRRFSLTELTMKVSKILPGQVRLTSLAFSQPESAPLVRLTVMGKSEEDVEKFLSSLEDSSDFKDIAVANEGFDEQGNPNGEVTMTCSAHYVGWQKP